MGWNTGILLFENMSTETVRAALIPQATPAGPAGVAGDALGSREAVLALGQWHDRSFLIDRYRALELTSGEADDTDMGQLAGRAGRVLVAYLHEVSGSYGIAIFENSRCTLRFYTQEGQVQHHSHTPNLSAPFAALPLPTDGDLFFHYIDLFMGIPFAEWAYTAECLLYER